MNWVRNWSRVALLYFVLAASFGILLRYLQTSFIGGLNYKFLLHTHSHIALLGWVYIALILAIVNSIRFSEPNLNNAGFRRILWFTNITVVGMMISFPVQGYGVVSITFSTLFLFASYWFVGWFFANVKSKPLTIGAKFIRSGLIYLVISSFGPWALGPIMVIGESHSDWYYMAIYFYLHFLYNGFFVMSIFGLVFYMLDRQGIAYPQSSARKVYVYTNISIVPAFILSALWMQPNILLYVLGGGAAILQIIAFLIFYPVLRTFMKSITSNNWVKIPFFIVFFSYAIKILLQAISSLPTVADFIYNTSQYTAIGYLHLVLLGFTSLFLVGYFINYKIYTVNNIAILGLSLFLFGLVASEMLLFSQGLITYTKSVSIPDFTNIMFYVSSFMPIGITLFGVGQLTKSKN